MRCPTSGQSTEGHAILPATSSNSTNSAEIVHVSRAVRLPRGTGLATANPQAVEHSQFFHLIEGLKIFHSNKPFSQATADLRSAVLLTALLAQGSH